MTSNRISSRSPSFIDELCPESQNMFDEAISKIKHDTRRPIASVVVGFHIVYHNGKIHCGEGKFSKTECGNGATLEKLVDPGTGLSALQIADLKRMQATIDLLETTGIKCQPVLKLYDIKGVPKENQDQVKALIQKKKFDVLQKDIKEIIREETRAKTAIVFSSDYSSLLKDTHVKSLKDDLAMGKSEDPDSNEKPWRRIAKVFRRTASICINAITDKYILPFVTTAGTRIEADESKIHDPLNAIDGMRFAGQSAPLSRVDSSTICDVVSAGGSIKAMRKTRERFQRQDNVPVLVVNITPINDSLNVTRAMSLLTALQETENIHIIIVSNKEGETKIASSLEDLTAKKDTMNKINEIDQKSYSALLKNEEGMKKLLSKESEDDSFVCDEVVKKFYEIKKEVDEQGSDADTNVLQEFTDIKGKMERKLWEHPLVRNRINEQIINRLIKPASDHAKKNIRVHLEAKKPGAKIIAIVERGTVADATARSLQKSHRAEFQQIISPHDLTSMKKNNDCGSCSACS
jgi:hypothetical protein